MQTGNILENVKELIKIGEYIAASNLIEMSLDLSGEDIKESIDLKGTILIRQGKFDEALELYKDTMIYEMISEKDKQSFENISNAAREIGKELHGKAMSFQAKMLEIEEGEAKQYIEPVHKETLALQEQILEGSKDYELYYKLAYNHILQLQLVEACIYYKAYEKYVPNLNKAGDEVSEFITNYQYVSRFYDQLEGEGQTYCLIAHEQDKNVMNKHNTLAEALLCLGHKVYIIMPVFRRKIETKHIEKDSLINEILQGITFDNNIGYIYPIELIKDEEIIYNSLDDLLLSLNSYYCKEDSWIILMDREKFKHLADNIEIFKITQKLYIENVKRTWASMSAVYMGNYLYTAKRMYGFDVPAWMEKAPEVKVSIVIPTRNCSYTLKDTLRTCLEQWSDDYEIVISDNSSPGDMETYNLIQEINSPKIKYYRTPYTLSLAKSFEYAYLRARGEFLFSIGSDDGVLPYTVQHLSKVLDDYPNDNVFVWLRLGYTWPELVVTGLADSFAFPALISKGPVTTRYLNSDEQMMYVFDLLNKKYCAIYDAMPSLYSNSGMRRRHIVEMIKATGKLLDGYSQDVYTSVLNLAICESVVYIDYPLATAGLCNRSVGLSSVARSKGIEKYKQLITEYNWCVETTDVPGTKSQELIYPQYDYLLFAYEVLKVVDLNLHPKCKKWKERMDLRNLLEWGIWQYLGQRSIYQDFIEIGKQCAAKQGEAVSIWFNQLAKIYEQQERPRQLHVDTSKRYAKGLGARNWVTIDASEFGLSNIYEVSQFFIKLYNL